MPDEREEEIKELIKQDKDSQKSSWKSKVPIIILAIIIVGSIIAFLVFGGTDLLNGQQNQVTANDQLSQDDTTETTLPATTDQAIEVPCSVTADCQEGYHCYGGTCVTNVVLESFGICTASENCTETCSSCNAGKYTCVLSEDEVINGHCTECFSDAECLGGYKCDLYRCVLR